MSNKFILNTITPSITSLRFKSRLTTQACLIKAGQTDDYVRRLSASKSKDSTDPHFIPLQPLRLTDRFKVTDCDPRTGESTGELVGVIPKQDHKDGVRSGFGYLARRPSFTPKTLKPKTKPSLQQPSFVKPTMTKSSLPAHSKIRQSLVNFARTMGAEKIYKLSTAELICYVHKGLKVREEMETVNPPPQLPTETDTLGDSSLKEKLPPYVPPPDDIAETAYFASLKRLASNLDRLGQNSQRIWEHTTESSKNLLMASFPRDIVQTLTKTLKTQGKLAKAEEAMKWVTYIMNIFVYSYVLYREDLTTPAKAMAVVGLLTTLTAMTLSLVSSFTTPSEEELSKALSECVNQMLSQAEVKVTTGEMPNMHTPPSTRRNSQHAQTVLAPPVLGTVTRPSPSPTDTALAQAQAMAQAFEQPKFTAQMAEEKKEEEDTQNQNTSERKHQEAYHLIKSAFAAVLVVVAYAATGGDQKKMSHIVLLGKFKETINKSYHETFDFVEEFLDIGFDTQIGTTKKAATELKQCIDKCCAIANKEPVEFAKHPELNNQLAELTASITQKLEVAKHDESSNIKRLTTQLSHLQINLMQLREKVNIFKKIHNTRVDPPFIMIRGERGHGKSHLITRELIPRLAKKMGVDPTYYALKLENGDFYNPYGGEKFGFIDEFGDRGAKDPLFLKINSICSGTHLNMQGAFIKEQSCELGILFAATQMVPGAPLTADGFLTTAAAQAFLSRATIFNISDPNYNDQFDRSQQPHRKADYSHLTISKERSAMSQADSTMKVTTVNPSMTIDDMVDDIYTLYKYRYEEWVKTLPVKAQMGEDLDVGESFVVHLLGEPGIGKTSMAQLVGRDLATTLGFPYVSVRHGDFPSIAFTKRCVIEFSDPFPDDESLYKMLYDRAVKGSIFIISNNSTSLEHKLKWSWSFRNYHEISTKYEGTTRRIGLTGTIWNKAKGKYIYVDSWRGCYYNVVEQGYVSSPITTRKRMTPSQLALEISDKYASYMARALDIKIIRGCTPAEASIIVKFKDWETARYNLSSLTRMSLLLASVNPDAMVAVDPNDITLGSIDPSVFHMKGIELDGSPLDIVKQMVTHLRRNAYAHDVLIVVGNERYYGRGDLLRIEEDDGALTVTPSDNQEAVLVKKNNESLALDYHRFYNILNHGTQGTDDIPYDLARALRQQKLAIDKDQSLFPLKVKFELEEAHKQNVISKFQQRTDMWSTIQKQPWFYVISAISGIIMLGSLGYVLYKTFANSTGDDHMCRRKKKEDGTYEHIVDEEEDRPAKDAEDVDREYPYVTTKTGEKVKADEVSLKELDAKEVHDLVVAQSGEIDDSSDRFESFKRKANRKGLSKTERESIFRMRKAMGRPIDSEIGEIELSKIRESLKIVVPQMEIPREPKKSELDLIINAIVRVHNPIGNVHGIALRDNYILTVAHCEKPTHITYKNKTYAVVELETMKAYDLQMLQVVDKSWQSARDITKHLLTEDRIHYISRLRFVEPNSDRVLITDLPATYIKSLCYDNDKQWRSNQFCADFAHVDGFMTAYGMCGLPYITHDHVLGRYVIAGIHAAAAENHWQGMCALATIEKVNILFEKEREPVPAVVKPQMKTTDHAVQINLKTGSQTIIVPELVLKYLKTPLELNTRIPMGIDGINPLWTAPFEPALPRKNKYVPTPFCHIAKERGYVNGEVNTPLSIEDALKHHRPPVAPDTQGKKSLEMFQVYKFQGAPASPPEKVFAESCRIFDSYLVKHFGGEKFKATSWYEAINGLNPNHPLSKFSEPLDITTAPGVIYTKMFSTVKKSGVVSGPPGKRWFSENPAGKACKEYADLIWVYLTEGRRVMTINCDKIKAELTSVDNYKTRLMSCTDLAECLAMRRLFATFTSELKSKRNETGMMLGVNPLTEFTFMMSRLRKVGGSGFEIDFKSYDKTNPQWVGKQTMKSVAKRFTPGLRKAVKTAGTYIYTAIHQILNGIYMVEKGNNSGGFMTSPYNTLCAVLSLIVLCAQIWYNKYGDLKGFDFWKHFAFAVMSDDVTLAVSPEMSEWLRASHIQAAASDAGLNLTVANERPEPLGNLNFLSRTLSDINSPDSFVVLPALKISSIKRHFFWTTDKSEIQYLDLLNTVLEEGSLHSRLTFLDLFAVVYQIALGYPKRFALQIDWRSFTQRRAAVLKSATEGISYERVIPALPDSLSSEVISESWLHDYVKDIWQSDDPEGIHRISNIAQHKIDEDVGFIGYANKDDLKNLEDIPEKPTLSLDETTNVKETKVPPIKVTPQMEGTPQNRAMASTATTGTEGVNAAATLTEGAIVSSVTMNPVQAPVTMLAMGGIIQDIRDIAHNYIDHATSYSVATGVVVGTEVFRMKYGISGMNDYAQAYVNLHNRYAGPIEYRFHCVGNAALSGEVLFGWVPDSDATYTLQDLQKYKYFTMLLNRNVTVEFTLGDARQNGFYRNVTGDDATKPAIVCMVYNELLNPYGVAGATVFINVASRLSDSFILAEPVLDQTATVSTSTVSGVLEGRSLGELVDSEAKVYFDGFCQGQYRSMQLPFERPNRMYMKSYNGPGDGQIYFLNNGALKNESNTGTDSDGDLLFSTTTVFMTAREGDAHLFKTGENSIAIETKEFDWAEGYQPYALRKYQPLNDKPLARFEPEMGGKVVTTEEGESWVGWGLGQYGNYLGTFNYHIFNLDLKDEPYTVSLYITPGHKNTQSTRLVEIDGQDPDPYLPESWVSVNITDQKNVVLSDAVANTLNGQATIYPTGKEKYLNRLLWDMSEGNKIIQFDLISTFSNVPVSTIRFDPAMSSLCANTSSRDMAYSVYNGASANDILIKNLRFVTSSADLPPRASSNFVTRVDNSTRQGYVRQVPFPRFRATPQMDFALVALQGAGAASSGIINRRHEKKMLDRRLEGMKELTLESKKLSTAGAMLLAKQKYNLQMRAAGLTNPSEHTSATSYADVESGTHYADISPAGSTKNSGMTILPSSTPSLSGGTMDDLDERLKSLFSVENLDIFGMTQDWVDTSEFGSSALPTNPQETVDDSLDDTAVAQDDAVDRIALETLDEGGEPEVTDDGQGLVSEGTKVPPRSVPSRSLHVSLPSLPKKGFKKL
ncbi:hypothetical protein [Beihai sea slater virus 1]|uniref:hypothetical protein n=1 Tax=Beihai sea slater virus 1 TaxID=1922657 RepID=UPI00090CC6DF|nr:hypothetical protein [Beihai sea slater virus 1]APG76777.1 hypothetical protein [Beihai sea slater virus 1]